MAHITGSTTEGLPTIGGLFIAVDSWGLPLDIVMQQCKAKGMVIDIPDFYLAAIKAGWNPKNAASKIREALADSYGSSAVFRFNEWLAITIAPVV